uniref:Hypothetical secreted peptide n=1 Tax=Simulium nigrimanum TaxID=683695 RepID=D1FPZ2_SIMNI
MHIILSITWLLLILGTNAEDCPEGDVHLKGCVPGPFRSPFDGLPFCLMDCAL